MAKRTAVSSWLGIIFVALEVTSAQAQRLAADKYTAADGLASNTIGFSYQDRRGYLWFATAEGLSRFDGYDFVNYTTADGLPHAVVNAVAEDGRGRLWVATNGGLARLIDDPPAVGQPVARSVSGGGRIKFVSQPVGVAGGIDSVVTGQDGRPWCVTADGLYRGDDADGRIAFTRVVERAPTSLSVPLLADRSGRIWIAVGQDLMVVTPDGVIRDVLPTSLSTSPILHMTEVAAGRVLIATGLELFDYEFAAAPSHGIWRRRPLTLEADEQIVCLGLDPDDSLWIGTSARLFLWARDALSASVIRGLSGRISSVGKDRDRSLWLTTLGAGAYRLPDERLFHYSGEDGLPPGAIARVVADARSGIYVSTALRGLMHLGGQGFTNVVGSESGPFNSLNQRVLSDSIGQWWINTPGGVFRLPGPAPQFLRRELVTGVRDLLPSWASGPSIYEDPRGVVWMGVNDAALYRSRIDAAPAAERVPLDPAVISVVARMVADPAGNLWLSSHAALARLSAGRLTGIGPTVGLPETLGRALFLDSRGWLWIGLRYRGISLTTEPAADAPRFVNYSSQHGLISDSVTAITEDRAGRIYVGTGRGLDRLDPSTGRIRHVATTSALAGAAITTMVSDIRGDVWIGTVDSGLFQLSPKPEQAQALPLPVYLTRVRVAGEELSLPERGTTHIGPLTFAPSSNSLMIDYVGLGLVGERNARYEYMLEPVDPDWSTPTDQRTIGYARLGAGSYRFLVRAIGDRSAPDNAPAAFEFRILTPVWLRWWFLAGVAMLLAGLVWVWHRARTRSLLAMVRLRQQVSLDLHDDIGAGLAQIAILSEVAKDDQARASTPMWTEVANLARGMRDSMSDIVWAIDPELDRLDDLVVRMKQVGFNLLESDGIAVEFTTSPPADLERVHLAPSRRRHWLLIFKEAVTNVSRHAHATRVWIELRVESGQLSLSIRDDGRGFDLTARSGGHGLSSLKRRASELGGTIEIVTAPGGGTTIRVLAPLH